MRQPIMDVYPFKADKEAIIMAYGYCFSDNRNKKEFASGTRLVAVSKFHPDEADNGSI
jgi:hypothetical protein